ncbi:MAG TPA: DUF2461 domain-containing protein [Flavobacteriales bacterium]|nr:DUF2461 domain-containing protein [Flavobacteriales bacterium]
MSFFQPAFTEYFAQLSENNSTLWFDQNRKWYEREVKIPFQDFVDELIIQLRMIDNDIQIEPSEAIFRINNDIRYTKEKIPYKTWMSANISAMGKRMKEYPGFFIQANHEHLILAGGVYNPEKDSLYQIRQQIAHDPDAFIQAVRNPEFLDRFGGLRGDQHIQLAPEFKELINRIPEITFKQFHFRIELDPSYLLHPNLPKFIADYFRSAQALHHFLRRAYKIAMAA